MQNSNISPPANPLLTAFLVFLVTAACAASLVWYLEKIRSAAQRAHVAIEANGSAKTLQIRLERNMAATYVLAALVREGEGTVANFETVANELLPHYPGVSALALAPAGIVQSIVPLAGNEKSVGHDMLRDPAREKESRRAQNSKQLTLSGPFNLIQGGQGAVARLPVYLGTGGAAEFWGFTTVLFRFPEALSAAHLSQLSLQDMAYQLWRIHPDSGQKQVIAASSGADLTDPFEVPLEVANTTWTLSVAPVQGWGDPLGLALNAALALFLSMVLGYLAKLLMELRAHRRGLEALVAHRTAEIRASRNQLHATIDAIPDLMWELGLDGRYHSSHQRSADLADVPDASFLGKSVSDTFDSDAADVIMSALREAHETGTSVGRQYERRDANGSAWFELSVSRKTVDARQEPHFVVLARDITKRRETVAKLRLSAKVFEQSNEGITVTDADRNIMLINSAFTAITGYSEAEVVGKNPRILSSGRQDREFYRAMWQAIDTLGHWQGEVWNRSKAGKAYPEWLSISRVLDTEGVCTNYIGIFSDMTRQKSAEEQIFRLGFFDPLTGLANRIMLTDRITHAINLAQRRNANLAVLVLDLDHFKHVNDSLGHSVGDELLKEVAARLISSVRRVDTVSRVSSDEFVLVLPDTDAGGAAHVAEKLLEAIAQTYWIDQHELAVTPSIGIAIYPGDGTDQDTLLKGADAAMYRAKEEGRNQYLFFAPEMQAHSARTLQLKTALRGALKRNQLLLHYQPQISLTDGRVTGVEALLRWEHPELGTISPAEFIPIAEGSGLIVPIGEWVLRTACSQMKAWQDAGIEGLRVAVNLSARQFAQDDLGALICRALEESGLTADHLDLELTESMVMTNVEHAIGVLKTLSALGVRLSIDDFGTGYSSLAYLNRFPIDVLKIDRSFIKDIPRNNNDAAIANAVISMAHSLGMRVLAEGVETEAQCEFLSRNMCDEIQGFLFSKALPAREMEAMLHESKSLPQHLLRLHEPAHTLLLTVGC